MSKARLVDRHEETRRRDSRYAAAGAASSIYMAVGLQAGDRVRFEGEKSARFKVRARGDRYIVLTYPFHQKARWRGNCVYTIIDIYHGIRGVDDCVGSLGYETETQIVLSLSLLEEDKFEISVRNNVSLAIAEVRR